ncbi:Hypothetical_protein [Hexamita inflata]|nr:Hypothetical protein HINF_LOCUS20650 [Hexamita inflata]
MNGLRTSGTTIPSSTAQFSAMQQRVLSVAVRVEFSMWTNSLDFWAWNLMSRFLDWQSRQLEQDTSSLQHWEAGNQASRSNLRRRGYSDWKEFLLVTFVVAFQSKLRLLLLCCM